MTIILGGARVDPTIGCPAKQVGSEVNNNNNTDQINDNDNNY